MSQNSSQSQKRQHSDIVQELRSRQMTGSPRPISENGFFSPLAQTQVLLRSRMVEAGEAQHFEAFKSRLLQKEQDALHLCRAPYICARTDHLDAMHRALVSQVCAAFPPVEDFAAPAPIPDYFAAYPPSLSRSNCRSQNCDALIPSGFARCSAFSLQSSQKSYLDGVQQKYRLDQRSPADNSAKTPQFETKNPAQQSSELAEVSAGPRAQDEKIAQIQRRLPAGQLDCTTGSKPQAHETQNAGSEAAEVAGQGERILKLERKVVELETINERLTAQVSDNETLFNNKIQTLQALIFEKLQREFETRETQLLQHVKELERAVISKNEQKTVKPDRKATKISEKEKEIALLQKDENRKQVQDVVDFVDFWLLRNREQEAQVIPMEELIPNLAENGELEAQQIALFLQLYPQLAQHLQIAAYFYLKSKSDGLVIDSIKQELPDDLLEGIPEDDEEPRDLTVEIRASLGERPIPVANSIFPAAMNSFSD